MILRDNSFMPLTTKITALFFPFVFSGCASLVAAECKPLYKTNFAGITVGEIQACDPDRNGEVDKIIASGIYFSLECPQGEYQRTNKRSGCTLSEEIWEEVQKKHGGKRNLYWEKP
ncbi:hypothetical protein J4421_00540 [Candidatus Woesearchaeota archaeon]|nr:hypothetical protein [Candidatus Woesearchaeota archaeon]